MTRTDRRVLFEIPDYWTSCSTNCASAFCLATRRRSWTPCGKSARPPLRRSPAIPHRIGTSDGRRAPHHHPYRPIKRLKRVAPSGPEPPEGAAVLAALKERPGSCEQASLLACRPSLTAAARVSRECPAVGTEVSLRRGRTKVRPRKGRRLCRRECGHHQPARLARVSKLASETHEIPRRTPPCALAGSIILSTAGSVLMSGDTSGRR